VNLIVTVLNVIIIRLNFKIFELKVILIELDVIVIGPKAIFIEPEFIFINLLYFTDPTYFRAAIGRKCVKPVYSTTSSLTLLECQHQCNYQMTCIGVEFQPPTFEWSQSGICHQLLQCSQITPTDLDVSIFIKGECDFLRRL